jgi:hypothetical protein
VVQKDGASLRSHLESIARQTGKKPKQLAEIPEMPSELGYIWVWFLELDAGRGGNGFGLNPLSYTEIQAWAYLKRVVLAAWEVEVIKLIDSARIRVSNEKRPE